MSEMAMPESKRKACPARRLFVPEVSEEAPEVVLTGPRKRYVRDVLRMGPGDSLVLFDGSGIEYPSAITEATRRHVKVRILGRQEGRRESPVDILIGIGLLKTNKMDLVIQKVSELGVREVHPFAAHRAVPALDPERAEQKRGRWQTIAQEASRQSGRSTVADVRPVLPFDEIVRQCENVDTSLLFTTEATSPLEALAQQQNERPRRMLLLVGPEGGFSPEEERIAVKQGFLPVGLGPRVLRAETAAILAVGLVQYRFGDLGGSPADLTPRGP
jgi:16S rRNA (uracil1498-N3)-methyltransferase